MARPSVGAALLVVLLAVSASSLRGDAAQTPAPAPPQGAITGVVYDATTGNPVPAATVSLSKTTGGFSFPRSITDSKGRFIFRGLEPSTDYYLGASRFGYEYTRYGWTGPDQSLATADIARVAVAKDQWVSDIRIPLWRPGSISGHAFDERGEPLVGVAVRAFSRQMVSGQEQLVAGNLATTDDRGRYRLSVLRPGQYVVAVLSVQSTVLQTTGETPATRPVGELQSGGIGGGRGATVSMPAINVDPTHRLVVTNFITPPPPSTDRPRAYPATFYPGVPSIADAAALDITYGVDRANIDIRVAPTPAVRVAGRLVMPAGEPPPALLLRLLPAGMERLGFGAEAATTTVEKDGAFVFLNVPPGTYTLLAQATVMDFTTGSTSTRLPEAPGFPGGSASVGSVNAAPGMEYLARSGPATAFYGRALVAVGADPIGDLVVPMRHTSTVSGRLVFPEGLAIPPGLFASVSMEPANGDPALGQPRGELKEGAFTIGGLLGGVYLFSNGLSSNNPTFMGSLRVASVTWQGRDVSVAGLDASAADDFRDVVITLTDKKIVVTGTVTGPAGRASSVVIAFPADRSRWKNFGWNPRSFATARSSPSGVYRFESLPAGDYYVVAVDPKFSDAWVDPKFLTAAVPFAARVTLSWGDTPTVDLQLATVVIK
ncbi:MAG TPA: carboxypeptidase regulatory-like domain-containing protein [Vicinamibacterales bacterium]|nr:carboxypeptidase regulatory-like domain-containing protein [Vicinamibacterales bacterium]